MSFSNDSATIVPQPSRSGRRCSRRPCSALAAGGRATGWERHTPLPEPRTEVSAATAGGEIVVVGGFVAAAAATRRGWTPTRSTDDRWRRLPDLPVSRRPRGSRVRQRTCLRRRRLRRRPAAAAYGLRARARRLARSSPRSRTRAPRRRRRSPVAGSTSSAASTDAGRSRAWPSRSRSARRRWTRIPGPSAREHLAAAASGGRVYAIGGRAAGIDTNMTDFEVYDAARQALAPARTAAGSARRHGRGGARRAHRLGRRRGAGRHDPQRLRLRRGDAPLVAAPGPPHAAPRPRRRRVNDRIWVLAAAPSRA